MQRWIILAAVLAVATASVRGDEITTIDSFEEGVGAWRVTDGETPAGHAARLAGIYAVKPAAPGGGQQAALVEFLAARNSWARVAIEVNGQSWHDKGHDRLAFHLKGDGSTEKVRTALFVHPPGAEQPVSYSSEIDISDTEWTRVTIRFFGFTDDFGRPLPVEQVRYIKALVFEKTGTWSACSFNIDMLQAITGHDPPPPEAFIPTVGVDFNKNVAPMLVQPGFTAGFGTLKLIDNPALADEAANLARQLAPCVGRIPLGGFRNPQTGHYDIAGVLRLTEWLGAAGIRPMVTLTPPGVSSSPRARTQFLEAALMLAELRRSEPVRYYELFSQPMQKEEFASIAEFNKAYNGLAEEILQRDPQALIGGPGFASAWRGHLEGFVPTATPLTFLSYHLYGAHNPVASDHSLAIAAPTGVTSDLPEQITPQQVLRLARSNPRRPEVFVTEAALNSALTPDGQSADPRTNGMPGAAWFAATAMAHGPFTDKLLYADFFGRGRGMVDENGKPTPVFHAAWLMKTYAPRGSTITGTVRPTPMTIVMAAATRTARNVLIAHCGTEPITLSLQAAGVGELKGVRERRLDGSTPDIQFIDLKKETMQKVELTGPTVTVIQFIPE